MRCRIIEDTRRSSEIRHVSRHHQGRGGGTVTVTIQRRDWHRGISYEDPCGCLLARAIRRNFKMGQLGVVVFIPGLVGMSGKETKTYSTRKHESRLMAAHRDPSLLPLTVRLR